MYIRGGYNVYPGEVEAALTGHPWIVRTAVAGVPDPVLGEIGVVRGPRRRPRRSTGRSRRDPARVRLVRGPDRRLQGTGPGDGDRRAPGAAVGKLDKARSRRLGRIHHELRGMVVARGERDEGTDLPPAAGAGRRAADPTRSRSSTATTGRRGRSISTARAASRTLGHQLGVERGPTR